MASLLRPSGDYRSLLSYQKAEQIYDLTYYFCKTYLSCRDRTVDQMVQAARSGKQNIAEGKEAGLTSLEMEIKLINVARASLDELLVDYEDFLRVRKLLLWEKDSREAQFVRKKGADKTAGRDYFLNLARTRASPEPETFKKSVVFAVLHTVDVQHQVQHFVTAAMPAVVLFNILCHGAGTMIDGGVFAGKLVQHFSAALFPL